MKDPSRQPKTHQAHSNHRMPPKANTYDQLAPSVYRVSARWKSLYDTNRAMGTAISKIRWMASEKAGIRRLGPYRHLAC